MKKYTVKTVDTYAMSDNGEKTAANTYTVVLSILDDKLNVIGEEKTICGEIQDEIGTGRLYIAETDKDGNVISSNVFLHIDDMNGVELRIDLVSAADVKNLIKNQTVDDSKAPADMLDEAIDNIELI